MDIAEIYNPFDAPVFHISETDSTMTDARQLAAGNLPDGTVIYADFQNTGRGRLETREWQAEAKTSLLCTVLLRRPLVRGFTLRIGLAIARTFDAFLDSESETKIKWPNDVLFEGKKLAGILCENNGSVLLVGTGLNIRQTAFPRHLAQKATSLAMIAQGPAPSIETVLSSYLVNLKDCLESTTWQADISQKLYRRGEAVRFLVGDPGNDEAVEGILEGIGGQGELLIRPTAGTKTDQTKGGQADQSGLLHLFSGEIPYPSI